MSSLKRNRVCGVLGMSSPTTDTCILEHSWYTIKVRVVASTCEFSLITLKTGSYDIRRLYLRYQRKGDLRHIRFVTILYVLKRFPMTLYYLNCKPPPPEKNIKKCRFSSMVLSLWALYVLTQDSA